MTCLPYKLVWSQNQLLSQINCSLEKVSSVSLDISNGGNIFKTTEREGMGFLFQLIFSMDLVVVLTYLSPVFGSQVPRYQKIDHFQPNHQAAKSGTVACVRSSSICNSFLQRLSDWIWTPRQASSSIRQCKCQHLFDC